MNKDLANRKLFKRKNAYVSDNIVKDFLDKISYRRLSLSEETHLIKCSKLSFYYDVSEEDREKYIRYFCEENPWFAEKLSLVTTDEERQVVISEGIDRSFEIRDKFIENFVLLAAMYARKIEIVGVSNIDLIQEGILGIIKALEKFDIDRNRKFSTYASWWIKQSISRYVDDNDRLIRVPVHQCEFIRKVLKMKSELMCEKGVEPTLKEISDALDVPVEKVEQAMIDGRAIVSLNQLVGEEEDIELGDFVVDPEAEYENSVIDNLFTDDFKDILMNSGLSERDLEILYMRYGFYDGRKYTLEQVGEVYGITRERVRQVEAKALVSLRKNKDVIGFFKDYFDDNADKVYKKNV